MVCTEHKDIRFLEGKVDRLSKTTLAAVVTRPKRDRLQVGKRGGKLTSTVDSRIYINVPKGLFKSPTQVYLEVQPLDGALISDFKSRACEDDAFISASAIMTISFQHKLTQPVLLNLPCPGGIKKKRPQTSGVKEKRSAPTRPTTSFGFRQKQDADDTTFVYLLTQNEHGGWVLRADAQLKPSTINDQVAIEWEETKERILLLRCKKMDKKGMVPRIEKLAKAVESFLYKRYVNFIVRQKSSEPRNIIIHPVLANKSERFIKKYAEDGYDDGPVGDDVAVHEGQRLEIKFRGNLQPSPDDYPDLEFVYNTALTEPITFSIAEVEKFAQKSLPIYKGFIQLCCLQSEDGKEEDNVLTEVCMTIPKPETEPPAEVRRAPLEIRTDGPVNNDTLRWLASELATSGDEWKNLSHYLRIPRARLQAIQRNCQGKGNESVIFELLMTWVKKVPRAKDKAAILCSALLRCGRLDLAEEMKDHDIDFKEERARSARSASLEKKFKSLSRSESVVSEWKTVASNLHLTTAEIREIEEDYEDENERCYQALQKWKEIDSGANLVTLAETLRACDLGVAADLVEMTS
ncbi:death domain-containing protein 1 [Lingula anatina]|uniref:Death domain-containing protein 1 n=1 Tax=Lingula anatina TaxID=7574 RepID=A0A2R2MRV4_LINAN|nr:death domain-containing protein 1 [Lingula anatina]|eukprot:XP_023932863.1 death domain-containing protein 1 [Lingula anatina]